MKKRILIVDDDQLITKIISQILTDLGGYETLVVNDPEKAIAAAESFGPTAVVLDYRMPVMTGEEVLTSLRQHASVSRLPAILLSGDSSWSVTPDRITVLLEKPITAKALLAAIRALLAQADGDVSLAA